MIEFCKTSIEALKAQQRKFSSQVFSLSLCLLRIFAVWISQRTETEINGSSET